MVERALINNPFVKAFGIPGQSPSHEHDKKKWYNNQVYSIKTEKEKEIPLKEIPNKKKGNSRMGGINCFMLLNN